MSAAPSAHSPYFFSSISDEYARRGHHVEIVRPDGERVIFVGRDPENGWLESSLLHPPLPDAPAASRGIEVDEPPVDIDSDGADWMLLLLALLFVATMLSIGAGLWTRGGITS